MNEKEALNIDIVADISGSMYGDPLYDAKDAMKSLINSVQFDAGDELELVSFSDGVYLNQSFTNDRNALLNCVDMLYTQNMTALYDALYFAVNKVAAQDGAKCVIAFTDGIDNYSRCDQDDVISLATRYHIPIFIIGIGSDDYNEASEIATQTGGKYYNIYNVSDMKSIYNDIYKEEKEMYMVEFTDTSGVNLFTESSIVVGYHTAKYGGEIYYSYTPNRLISVDQNTFFTDGPEGVVSMYMKQFAQAMTYMDYSYIEPYLKQGSPIAASQQKYVLKGIDEVLDSYEIENVEYQSADKCLVTTRETYFVQRPDGPLRMLTQRCAYIVERENGAWQITDFAQNVEVLSNIKY